MYKKIKVYLPLVTLSVGILIALMSIFTVLKTNDGDAIMTGFVAVFGGEVAAFGTFASVDVQFSFFSFLAFFLPFLLSLGLFFVDKTTKLDKLINILLGLLLAIVYVYALYVFVNLGVYTKGTATILGIETTYSYEGAKLAIGAVLGVVFAVIGVLASLLQTFITLKD
jgi:hypothetical protein